MSEKMKVPEKFKNDVQYRLRSIAGKNANVKMYENLALKLSKLVGKTPAWSWRYVQSVCSGSVEPSKKFMLAIERYTSPKPQLPQWLIFIKKKIRRMTKETRNAIKAHVTDG